MARPRVLVLRAAGVNNDAETACAFEQAGAAAERVHVNRLAEGGMKLADFDILALPGGFSYGDDVASGKILAVEIMGRLGDAMRAFVEAGRPVTGICNGFQVLVKTGLLPATNGRQRVTLTTNDSGRFEDRWVRLAPDAGAARCLWTRGVDAIELPVAHGEGKFVAPPEILSGIEAAGQVVFRYADAEGAPTAEYPANPNGSMGAVAGLTDPTGRILGLMPHPERNVRPFHHPRWTRFARGRREGEGLAIFRRAVEHVKR